MTLSSVMSPATTPANAGSPHDKTRLAEYESGPYAGIGNEIREGFAATVPADADVSAVAEAIVKVVDLPFGKRPFRVHIDPAQDGAEIVNGVPTASAKNFCVGLVLKTCSGPPYRGLGFLLWDYEPETRWR
jgi:hypothetical protein